MRIVVTNTMGGTGKSATALLLATALAPRGSVEILDADPQGSASEWALRAEEDDTPLPCEVHSANRAQLRRAASSTADFLIIDTAPGDTQAINEALVVADVAVIPTTPSAMDMARTWSTETREEPEPGADSGTGRSEGVPFLIETPAGTEWPSVARSSHPQTLLSSLPPSLVPGEDAGPGSEGGEGENRVPSAPEPRGSAHGCVVAGLLKH